MEKNESIGIVSGAYSVGRIQLLKWINDFAQLNYSKIEQTASGVFVCHVFDALYPGELRLGKVKFNAKHPVDFINNYKVLQSCFNKVGMKRQIQVEKLIKGKCQDNFEFMQWVKAYFEAHASEDARNYNALQRRQEVMGRTGSISSNDSLPISRNNSRPTTTPVRKPISNKSSTLMKNRQPLYNSQPKSPRDNVTLKKFKDEIQQLKTEKEELQAAIEDAVTEREFYFNKLRKVELICQAALDEPEEISVDFLNGALVDIKAVLYAEDDEPVEDNPDQQQTPVDGDAVDGEPTIEGQFDDDDEDGVYQDVNHPAYQDVSPAGNGHSP